MEWADTSHGRIQFMISLFLSFSFLLHDGFDAGSEAGQLSSGISACLGLMDCCKRVVELIKAVLTMVP